jgi:hypothetical protein
MKTIVCTLLTDAVAFPTGYDMPDDKRWIVTTSSRRPLADIAKELMEAGVDVTLQPEDAAPSDSEMW